MFRPKHIIPLLLIIVLMSALAPVLQAGVPAHHQATIQSTTSHAAAIAQPMAKGTDTVYLTRTGQCYHRDGCSCLRKSKIKTTRAEAIKRDYRACKLCKP